MSQVRKEIVSIPTFGECSYCGKQVDYAEFVLYHKGKVYIFCSKYCFRSWLRETRIHYG
ncbi:MAG: TRASH domain-containing protein [Sulfolobaceae archaeon]|nr:TRASH domain-containing protein [Sulfolobaceae archaeon]